MSTTYRKIAQCPFDYSCIDCIESFYPFDFAYIGTSTNSMLVRYLPLLIAKAFGLAYLPSPGRCPEKALEPQVCFPQPRRKTPHRSSRFFCFYFSVVDDGNGDREAGWGVGTKNQENQRGGTKCQEEGVERREVGGGEGAELAHPLPVYRCFCLGHSCNFPLWGWGLEIRRIRKAAAGARREGG